jgi:hypothetical protein
MVGDIGGSQVTYQEPLSQKAVAISISESADMMAFGLAAEHLRDAMTEVARHLLAMGARLVYGGDLRAHGFTELLFELVARHRRDADVGDARPAVVSYLAWPVHSGKPAQEIQTLAQDLKGLAELHCLGQQGQELALDVLSPAGTAQLPTGEEWALGLTALRRVLTDVSDARIVLGGPVSGFKGRMPGIAEEALCSLNAGQPLYVLGGFGGCAWDIAEELHLVAHRPKLAGPWAGREQFSGLDSTSLRNGLSSDENETLARTVHVDEAVALVLRGLLRVFGGTDGGLTSTPRI